MSIDLIQPVASQPAATAYFPRFIRLVAKPASILARVVLTVADEIAYVIGQDLRDGQISRDPKDWEL